MPAHAAGADAAPRPETAVSALEAPPDKTPPAATADATTDGTEATQGAKGEAADKRSGKKAGKKPAKNPAKKTPRKRPKGLRRRKKDREPEAPPETVEVRVRGLSEPVQVEKGKKLLDAGKQANLNFFWGPWAQVFNCRGKGYCNLCRVEVLEGADNLAPRTKREQKRLADRPDSWRLACTAIVNGPIEIDTFPVRDPEKVARPEAIRRALLTPEGREEERRNRREATQAERAEARAATKADERKAGLLARLAKKKGKGSEDEASGKGDKGDKGSKKRGFGKKKDKDAEPPKDEANTKSDAAKPDDTRPGDSKAAKGGSFGLKGRKKK